MTRTMRSGHHLWLVLVVAAGCGHDLPPEALAAERARELQLLDHVPVVEMTREEFAAQAAQRAAAITDEELRRLAETYGRLGYFDMRLDLRPIIAGSSSDWVGATYSPSQKLITLVGTTRPDILVHEFVHALQDQHFHLRTYDLLTSSDAFLSRRAAVEGDAVLAQYRFLAQEDGRDLDAIDWQRLFQGWRDFSLELLATSEYPILFLDYVSFVYAYGLEYAAANLTGVTYERPEDAQPAPHSWPLQDELFLSRPPGTTQQILARDVKGDLAAVDPVVNVGLRTVPEGLGDRLTAVDWDSLGQWYIYLLLLPLELAGSVDGAAALAAAWDGDSVLFARDRTTGEVVSVWTSAWDDDVAAAGVAEAMRALHGASPPTESHLTTAADGELMWIEQRGTRLVVAKNIPEDIADALVTASFGDLSDAPLRTTPSLAVLMDRMRPAQHCHDHSMLVIPSAGISGGLHLPF